MRVKSCVKAKQDGASQRTLQGDQNSVNDRGRDGGGIRHRRKGGNSILPTSIYLMRARPLDGVGRIKMEI